MTMYGITGNNGRKHVRVSARMTGAALVVSAALLLTGCNGDTPADAAGGGDQSSSSTDQPTADGGGSGGDSGGDVSIDADALNGRYEHSTIPKPDYVSLILTPDQGVVVTTESASCIGDYDDSGKIETKCKKGKGFESGTITDAQKEQLTIAWDGGKTQVFERAHDM